MNRSLEHRQTPWAIRPETMPMIAQLLRRGMSAEENDRVTRQAARRGGPRVAGGIAVLSLRGVITPRPSILSMIFGFGGGGLQGFRENFREALSDTDIAAIVLDIDSPGGLIDLVPETAAEIRAARGIKPIIAVANTMAASAAYWIAAQADEIVVTPSGEVGSIGVFTTHEDWSKFDEKLGVATTLISAGKFKVEGNPFEPLSADARAAIQGIVDELYGMFIADVAAGRKVKAADVSGGFGEGRLLTAKRALAAGMVDRIETLEDTIARVASGDQLRPGLSGLSVRALAARLASADPELDDETDDDELPEDLPAPAPEPEVDPESDEDPDPDLDPDETDDEDDDAISAASRTDWRRRLTGVQFG